jgi:hypothetical protein
MGADGVEDVDVEEIIVLAARHAGVSPDALTITELVDIGAALGFEREAVDGAARRLETRRAAQRAAAEKKLASRHKALRVALAVSISALLVSSVLAWVGRATLATSLGRVFHGSERTPANREPSTW